MIKESAHHLTINYKGYRSYELLHNPLLSSRGLHTLYEQQYIIVVTAIAFGLVHFLRRYCDNADITIVGHALWRRVFLSEPAKRSVAGALCRLAHFAG